jgi:very-short-patch-repair endonuclease
VDFVICDPETTRPLLVIELDDRSHRDKAAQRRGFDAWKDQALRAAGMPAYRAPTREAYDVRELAETVERMIANAQD